MSSSVDELEPVNPHIAKDDSENVHVNGDVDCIQNNDNSTRNSDSEHQTTKDDQHEIDKVLDNKQTNELKNDRPDHEIVFTEYERMKDELIKVQNEYKKSLERERDLCEKLKNSQQDEDIKISQLSRVNEDLREQFKDVIEELNTKKDELKVLKTTLEETQKERDKYSTQLAKLHIEKTEEKDSLHVKIASLDKENQRLEDDLESVKDKLQAHDTAAKRAINAIQKEMALRVDQVTKMYEEALKDKENAVTKMTQFEDEKKKLFVEKELLNGKILENSKDMDKLKQKCKSMISDFAKTEANLEEKEKECSVLQKEQATLKEEVNSQVVKVKWAQNKLKNELELHKETKTKLNQTTQKLQEAREEGEMIRRNCQELIKKYQESEEMKSNSLDQKLKEKESELKRNEQEIADQDEIYKVKVQELVTLRNQERIYQEEINNLKEKALLLEEKVTASAIKVAEHEKNALTLKSDTEAMRNKLELANSFKTKYESEVQTVAQLNEDKEMLESHIHDLEAEISGGTNNQSQLLEFTEKLTAKNVQLQSEVTSIQSKYDSLLTEKAHLDEQLEEIRQKKASLEKQFSSEKCSLEKKVEELTVCSQEKTKAVEQLSLSLEEAKDELQVTKRKNNAAIKDLTRQLQQSRKQVEKLESNHHGSKESLNGETISKSSSTNSLDKINSNYSTSPPTTVTHLQSNPAMTSCVTDSGVTPQDSVQIVQPVQPQIRSTTGPEMEVNKKMLVDKICRLQKIHAKKNEKLEFMEEHINALVEEIQKKARIIQFYALRDQAGALAPAKSDMNKVQLSRHGGIMASLYSSKPSDPDMSLELSLEINRKLQTVLEDTILKNITLKENLDTLGDEISRLNDELKNLKQCGR